MIIVSSVNPSKKTTFNKINSNEHSPSFGNNATPPTVKKKDAVELTKNNETQAFKGIKPQEPMSFVKDKGLLVLIGLTISFIGLVTYVMTKSNDNECKQKTDL